VKTEGFFTSIIPPFTSSFCPTGPMLTRNARQWITPAGQNATKQAGERTEGVELAVVFPANRVPPGVLDRPPSGASGQPHNRTLPQTTATRNNSRRPKRTQTGRGAHRGGRIGRGFPGQPSAPRSARPATLPVRHACKSRCENSGFCTPNGRPPASIASQSESC